jgi:hypothetical protein
MKLNKAEFSLIVCELCIFGMFALALILIIGTTVEFTTGYELLP